MRFLLQWMDLERFDNVQLVRHCFVFCGKKPEELILVEEEFQHKNLCSNNACMGYGPMGDIPKNVVEKDGDLTALE